MGYFWVLLFLTGLRPAPATSDPNDESCLTHFYSSLLDPTPTTLKNWTRPNFATPCNGFDSSSHLSGATCNNARIYRLSLSNLSLRGTLSPIISLCSNLQHLDLSGNFLAGKIPPEISNLSNLAFLNLAGNRFSGEIPASLYLCAYLNVIDLHNNQLVGPVPQELGLLIRLNTFDVSYNKLSGMIPGSIGNRTGNLVKINATSFEGNRDLYGYPLDPYRNTGLSVVVIVLIGLGSGLVSLVVSFGIVCVWLRVSENNNNMVVAQQGKISNLMPDY